jgi:hypothetical protein
VTGHDADPMIIAGCSRRKLQTVVPVSALDLYQGGCIPALRARAQETGWLRARTWILSAEHGLLHADDPLLPYDRRMDSQRAARLRPAVLRHLREEFAQRGVPREVLVIAGPLYQLALADLVSLAGAERVRWVDDPAREWGKADAVIDTWRMPCP